jgi:NADPH-dependent 2,4-dienoyl-CoA reductase/sulfur reductase-like enzyme/Fe-S-cluster-containing hydrogenase component 2/bacterioferritin-associated ferredoxin
MPEWRIEKHPILPIPERRKIHFYWNRKKLEANEGEVIAAALFANGIHVFGHHVKDGSPLGIFCANGQCAQCTVIANGVPVKSCMTKVEENMIVESVEGLPKLPITEGEARFSDIEEVETDVLIVGGGPAGLSAALQLGERGIETLVVDDKDRLGGKLVLQTHKFFGSIDDCYAGTRGTDIAQILENELQTHPSVTVWLNSTVLYVFSDKKVGIITDGGNYRIVNPKAVLNAAGAREKSLVFPGNTLPGVYGAGAFQTLVNRDLVRAAGRLFVVGGGNVGIIAAYHALQAGITVVGLIEALPQVGGYQVHANKIQRLGVPIHTRHTILSANGEDHVESVTVSKIDDHFERIPGTERTFACDTVLIAVGLNPVKEFFLEAEAAGMAVFEAGDAREIAEASSAMFSGKIAGMEVAGALGKDDAKVPRDWYEKADLLKSQPGPISEPRYQDTAETGIRPVIHCHQEIPCNPCVSVCKQGVIQIPGGSLLEKPEIVNQDCVGCNKCLFICPGLAISLVDYRKDPENPIVSLPYEVYNYEYKKGDTVLLTDCEGRLLQRAVVTDSVLQKASRKTQIIKVQVPRKIAQRVAGFRIQKEADTLAMQAPAVADGLPDDATVCYCERVTAGEIRKLIRNGVKDLNQIKAITRAGMGACGAKTCENLILQLYREEGVPLETVTPNTRRPVFVETPLGVFANTTERRKTDE